MKHLLATAAMVLVAAAVIWLVMTCVWLLAYAGEGL